MKILITGATGLIGKALVNHFSAQHELTLVGRSREKIQSVFSNRYPIFTWNELKAIDESSLADQDIVINLAGENIGDQRWSALKMQKIIDSRVDATKTIATLCKKLGKKSPRLLNAGAIGIYGFSDEKIFSEESGLPDPSMCFLTKVASRWENELKIAEDNSVSVVRMRFGVVLSRDGGALTKMLPAFQLGLGAVLGNGKQLFSWVQLDDLVRAIDFIITHPEITGPVNIVSPDVVSQAVFAKSLAHTLKRPLFLRFPAWFVKLLFGKMGDELLLHGQHVKSEKLLKMGFQFQFDTIDKALQHSMNA